MNLHHYASDPTRTTRAWPPREIHAVPVSPYFRWKRWISPLAAAVLLVPSAPLILAMVVLVRLTSPGPGIYRQQRVGERGKVFTMYKIRTMHADAEHRGPQWTTHDADPRITPVGRALRKLHLDEFPQLINVLRGDMDLIGPRPERPEFTLVLAREIPGYLHRLRIRPGITGLAQINLPADSDLDSVRCKLKLDLEYIASAGPLLDLRMTIATGLRLFGLHSERALRLMRLRRSTSGPDRAPLSTGGPSLPHLAPQPQLRGGGAETYALKTVRPCHPGQR